MLTTVKSLDELNEMYAKWLEEDYQRKVHSGTGTSPLDYFLLQVSKVKMISDPRWLMEAFLMRTTRKVNHDATLQMGKALYETDQRLSGMRVEVRYDPTWLIQTKEPLLLYMDGKKVGEARYVNFRDNAYVRRNRGHKPDPKDERGEKLSDVKETEMPVYAPSINFSEMMRGE